jgi:acyl-CoA synthetase (AMP-forming)/AMP-acid ligase II
VIRKPGASPSEGEIKQFALAHAPAYQHPRFVWFVDELPLSSTNKIDRGALRRRAEQEIGATADHCGSFAGIAATEPPK